MVKNRSAFSLIEILIAMAIIATMAALIGPSAMRYFGKAKESATKSTLASLKQAIQDYTSDVGHPPTAKEGGLNALMEQPKDQRVAKKWDGPYLEGEEELPTDGWGYDFIYNTGKDIMHKKKYRHYEILSAGENNDLEEGKNFDIGA